MFAAHFEPEIQDGRVVRCTGTTRFVSNADDARADGEAAERRFVVADERGRVS